MRPILFMLLAFAPLFAQDSINIPQRTVADNAGWIFVYELDHGASAQTVTIDVSITTLSTSGVRIRILDLDQKVVAGPQDEAEDVQVGGGTANAQLMTQSRSGAHPLVVIVQTAQAGSSIFTGNVAVNAGALAVVNSNQDFRVTQGLFMPFGLYAAFNESFTTTANFTTNIVVDFGATPQAPTFRFEGIGTGMVEARLYDVTGGNTLISTIYAAPSGTMSTSDFVTTASYSGLVEFRIEVQGNGSAGDFFWATWLPDSLTVVSASGDGVGSNTKGNVKDGGGGGCVASGQGAWLAVALPALATLARRRKQAA